MREEFEDRDLSDSVFWGVDLRRVTFRDADLSGSTFFHTQWSGVTVDGVVDRLVVNGVDVTDYVNERDRWYPLRTQLSPDTVEGMRATWATLCAEWAALLARVAAHGGDVAHRSVNGEWSLRDTLRHLLFAMDKWFAWPVLGDRAFSPYGLPNSGSQHLEWPGIDRAADPELDTVLAARAAATDRLTNHLATLDLGALPATVDVLENGEVPTVMCFHVVFEEEFEHLRYALRDLALLGVQ